MRTHALLASLLLLLPTTASAAVVTDFEAGAASYDNTNPPVTGLFRDIANGGSINLTDNGAANDFLQVAGSSSNSGTTPRTFVYDTDPATTAPTLLSIPVGFVGTFTLELASQQQTVQPDSFGFGLFDPDSTSATGAGFYGAFNYRRNNSSESTSIRLVPATDRDSGGMAGATTAASSGGSDFWNGGTTPPIRLDVIVANNGATVTLRALAYEITGLDGSLVDATPEFDTGDTVVTIGAGAGELDLDLATGAALYFSSRNGRDGVNVDNLTMSIVPEPASLALLGLGGLAMISRRR